MRDRCARAGRGQCRTAGVGKQVQHLDRAVRLLRLRVTDDLREPRPVHRLLREEPGVLEAERLQQERQVQRVVADAPLLRQVEELPLAASAVAPVVVRIRLPPPRVRFLRGPDNLRIRAHQDIVAPALQFLPARRIEHGIFLPLIGY